MVRPAATFSVLVAAGEHSRPVLLWRRPLAVAVLLGCVVSLLSSGLLTIRFIVPAVLAWSYVPFIQILALLVVTWPRRRVVPMGRAVDLFFSGYGPWAIFLVGLAASFAFSAPVFSWGPLKVALAAMAVIVMWSACLDFWFFRIVYRAQPLPAIRDVVLVRLISWTLIFWIFAVPSATPIGVLTEIAKAVRELAR